jgi:hypothetical protein
MITYLSLRCKRKKSDTPARSVHAVLDLIEWREYLLDQPYSAESNNKVAAIDLLLQESYDE